MLARAFPQEMIRSALSISVELIVGHHEPDGTFVEEIRQPAHSIVQQLPQLMLSKLSVQAVTQNINDTTNTAKTLNNSVNAGGRWCSCNAAIATTATGIQLGTGVTAVAMTDYAIETLIAEGTGAGQLNYAAVVFAALGTSGSNRIIDITRSITNNSAGAINVKEAALVGIAWVATSTTANFALCHDALVYTHGIGVTKVITYRFTVALT